MWPRWLWARRSHLPACQQPTYPPSVNPFSCTRRHPWPPRPPLPQSVRPENVPKGLIGTVVITTATYILMSLSLVLMASCSELAANPETSFSSAFLLRGAAREAGALGWAGLAVARWQGLHAVGQAAGSAIYWPIGGHAPCTRVAAAWQLLQASAPWRKGRWALPLSLLRCAVLPQG